MADNQRLVQGFYDLLASGELDLALDLFGGQDAFWSVPGRGGLAGEFEGREAIRGALTHWCSGEYGRFERSMHAVCAADDGHHVYAQYLLRMERDGQDGKVGVIDAWHVRDGQLAHVWTFFEDQYRFDDWTGRSHQ
jgi:ketosteroid isomerase-like protein